MTTAFAIVTLQSTKGGIEAHCDGKFLGMVRGMDQAKAYDEITISVALSSLRVVTEGCTLKASGTEESE